MVFQEIIHVASNGLEITMLLSFFENSRGFLKKNTITLEDLLKFNGKIRTKKQKFL